MREYVDNSTPSAAREMIEGEASGFDSDDMDSFSGINEDDELVELPEIRTSRYDSSDDFDDDFSDDLD